MAENSDCIYEGTKEIIVSSEVIDVFHKQEFIEAVGLGELHPNQYVHLSSDTNPKHSGLAKYQNSVLTKIRTFDNVWGISSRNREQAFGLEKPV